MSYYNYQKHHDSMQDDTIVEQGVYSNHDKTKNEEWIVPKNENCFFLTATIAFSRINKKKNGIPTVIVSRNRT